MDRRTYLSTTAALATAGLAGCSSDSGDDKFLGQPTKTLSTPQGAEAKHLAFGETVDVGRASVTLSDPRATKTYRWSESGEQRSADAGEGKQWLLIHARAENTADRTARLPITENFKGVVGNRVFHPGRNKSVTAKYIGGKVDPGGVREGDVAYLAPESVSVDDFRVLYRETRPSGDHRVWWEP